MSSVTPVWKTMMDKSSSQISSSLAFFWLTAMLSLSSHANEYSLDYSVEGGYEYNDNVGMRAEDQIDISGGKITVPATLTMRSERLESSLMGELTSAKYDDSGFNSDDQNLQGNTRYQLERGEVAGYAGYKRDSTRTSEFLDTGIVGLRAARVDNATVGGSGDYMFTENNGIVIGADYSDLNYDSPLLDNYDYISGYTGWQHQWTERTRLRLQGIANRYENDANVQVTSDSLGAQIGFDSQFSEQLSVFLLAGWVNVDTDYSTNSTVASPEGYSSDVFQMNGSLNYQQERYRLTAAARSGTRPSGSGNLVKTDQLDLTYRYDVSEHSRFELGLVGGRNRSLNSSINTNRDDRDFARVRLRLDYRISQSWYVAGAYVFSYEDRERADGQADSNQINISLIFQPVKSVWSR